LLGLLFEEGERLGQKPEVLNAWLEEIRGNAAACPTEPVLRARLAHALSMRGIYARERQQYDVSDSIIDQLNHLFGQFPTEEAVGEELGRMLATEVISTPVAVVLVTRRPHLAAIQALARRFPGNKGIRTFVQTTQEVIEKKLREAGPEKILKPEESVADLRSFRP
jgi:hypothetical protein